MKRNMAAGLFLCAALLWNVSVPAQYYDSTADGNAPSRPPVKSRPQASSPQTPQAKPASEPFTGSFGPPDAAPPAAGTMPSDVPPAFSGTQPTPPAVPATPAAPNAQTATTAPAAPQAPPDPCAAYMGSYDAYAFCQDRLKKIERMKEASTKRSESSKAYYDKLQAKRNPPAQPAPAAATPGAAPVPAAATDAAPSVPGSTPAPATTATPAPAPAKAGGGY